MHHPLVSDLDSALVVGVKLGVLDVADSAFAHGFNRDNARLPLRVISLQLLDLLVELLGCL